MRAQQFSQQTISFSICSVKKARQVLSTIHIAVLAVDATIGLSAADRELIEKFEEMKLPYIIAYNKADLIKERKPLKGNEIYVSALTNENIYLLKEKIGEFAGRVGNTRQIVADLLDEGDMAVLVIPIDQSAPKGRLIMPQQQTIREILDAHCSAVVCQETELRDTLGRFSVKPKLVITDSQAFGSVAKDAPADIMLTSFSILMARYKGDLGELVKGAAQLGRLKDGDKVLISEGCTHHRQCQDIGTVKMPAWVDKFTGASLEYSFTSGGEFPEHPEEYSLIIHCGGCMLNEKEMAERIRRAASAGVPIVNYGIAIAHMHGILRRSLEPFPQILKELSS